MGARRDAVAHGASHAPPLGAPWGFCRFGADRAIRFDEIGFRLSRAVPSSDSESRQRSVSGVSFQRNVVLQRQPHPA
jgi:hypothetical protein